MNEVSAEETEAIIEAAAVGESSPVRPELGDFLNALHGSDPSAAMGTAPLVKTAAGGFGRVPGRIARRTAIAATVAVFSLVGVAAASTGVIDFLAPGPEPTPAEDLIVDSSAPKGPDGVVDDGPASIVNSEVADQVEQAVTPRELGAELEFKCDGLARDKTTESDCARPDAATTDEADPGEPDTDEADPGEPDPGEPDSGEPDSGEPDSGEPDSGEPDSGEPDSGGDGDGSVQPGNAGDGQLILAPPVKDKVGGGDSGPPKVDIGPILDPVE